MILGALLLLCGLVVAAGSVYLGAKGGGALYERYTPEARLERALAKMKREKAQKVEKARAELERRLGTLETVKDLGPHWDEMDHRYTPQSHLWKESDDPEQDLLDTLDILNGEELKLQPWMYIERSRGNSYLVHALLCRPWIHEDAEYAAAVLYTAQGIIRHSLIRQEVMDAACVYRSSLRNWPDDAAWYGIGGEIETHAKRIGELLDPAVRETYKVLADGWQGDIESAITAAKLALNV